MNAIILYHDENIIINLVVNGDKLSIAFHDIANKTSYLVSVAPSIVYQFIISNYPSVRY